ncbi:PIF-like orf1 [Carex littledalei]|uniref:PIF-like orf1 n=1 Tax=Carex littledalei TaxID=544730 RepID=A0A833VXU3_9POAL|nr:PIF-like orf1 [Carex littledalei]
MGPLDEGYNCTLEILVTPEAKRFRRHGIDPELEQKLDKMFTVSFDLDEYAPTPSDAEELVYLDEPEPEPKRSRKRKSGDNSVWQDKSEKMELVVDQVPREPVITNNPVEKTLSPEIFPKVEVVLDPDQRSINRQDRLPDEFESRSKATSIKCDHTCSITDAVRLLDSISEVPKASPLYYFAIKLILDKDKREVFMALSPETKVWWLKMEKQESRK